MTPQTESLAAQPSENTDLNTIIAFLLGEGPLDGVWFGDLHPERLSAKYWWRDKLREFRAAQAGAAAPSDAQAIIDVAQQLQDVQHWAAQAGSKILAEIAGRMLKAAPSATGMPGASDDLLSRLRELAAHDAQPLGRLIAEAAAEIADLRAQLARQGQGEPIGEVMDKPDNEHGTLSWPRVVWKGGLFAVPPVGTKLYAAPVAQAAQSDAVRDAALRFVNEAINCAFDGGDFDGGTIQDLAEKLGLLKKETMREPCGEGCRCADSVPFFPAECYRKTYLAALRTTHPEGK